MQAQERWTLALLIKAAELRIDEVKKDDSLPEYKRKAKLRELRAARREGLKALSR